MAQEHAMVDWTGLFILPGKRHRCVYLECVLVNDALEDCE